METKTDRDCMMPPFRASKWVEHCVLLHPDNIRSLFDVLSPFFLYSASHVMKTGEESVSVEQFLSFYERYYHCLCAGLSLDPNEQKFFFSLILTRSKESLFFQNLSDNRCLVRVTEPVIQFRQGFIARSEVDRSIHTKGLSKDGLSFGLVFSYPHLYFDPKRQAVYRATEQKHQENRQCFIALQRWLRERSTIATFLDRNEKVRPGLRIDQQVSQWLSRYTRSLDLILSV